MYQYCILPPLPLRIQLKNSALFLIPKIDQTVGQRSIGVLQVEQVISTNMSANFSLFLQVLFELQAESRNLLDDVNPSEMYDLLKRRRKKSRLQMESGGVWPSNKSHQSHQRMGELVRNRSAIPLDFSQKCCLFGSWCKQLLLGFFSVKEFNTRVYVSFLVLCIYLILCIYVSTQLYKFMLI